MAQSDSELKIIKSVFMKYICDECAENSDLHFKKIDNNFFIECTCGWKVKLEKKNP